MNIGIYGRTNIGKSTLLNFLCGQNISIVSPQSGTTTDPVRKRIEIIDYAPVTFIDTAGLDDNTPLSDKRIAKTFDTLEQIDLAIIVIDTQITHTEQALINKLADTPYITIDSRQFPTSPNIVFDLIKSTVPAASLITPPFYGEMLNKGETVILVCPIDSETPSGRLILPQVQAIRAALDLGAIAITVTPDKLSTALEITQPNLIVTDSQVFDIVKKITPRTIPLTSFSILLAEIKGDKEIYTKGLEKLETLNPSDRILILENCSHQISCHDIGRVKIPQLLDRHVGSPLDYTLVSGRDPLPCDLNSYAFAVQCGGCMTTRGHIQNRIRKLIMHNVPVTNYGMLLRTLL